MDESKANVSNIVAVKPELVSVINTERIKFVVKRIKILRPEYESLKKVLSPKKCYVFGCSLSTVGNCYSPTCARFNRVQQELIVMLKELKEAKSNAIAARNEGTLSVNRPVKRELSSSLSLSLSFDEASPSPSKRLKCNCDDTPTKIHLEKIGSPKFWKYLKSSRSSAASASPSTSVEKSPKCCLKQRCASLLNSNLLHDVTFVVGEGDAIETMPAHKSILAIGSDVFKTMFCENWSTEAGDTVKIPDVKPLAFSALLKFFYTDEVSVTFDTATDILYAAKKYSIQHLEDCSVNILIENLSPQNAFATLYYGELFEEQQLIDASLEAIDDDTDAAVLADDFCNITTELLRMVLERDSLTIEEVKLFNAVLRWSAAECGRRNLPVDQESQKLVLKELLPLVRFPLISTDDITSIVSPTGLLSNEELLALYQSTCKNPKLSIATNSVPRFWTKFKVNRFQEICCPFIQGTNAVQFQVDYDVRLLGVGLYGSLYGAANYSVKLFLKELHANQLILMEAIDCFYDGSSLTYEVLLKSPIRLIATTDYVLITEISGPVSFYGKSGMEKVTADLPHDRTVTINFSSFIAEKESPQTNLDQGQIPELILSA